MWNHRRIGSESAAARSSGIRLQRMSEVALLMKRSALCAGLLWIVVAATGPAAAQEPDLQELLQLDEVAKVDFDGMVERRAIRALVVYNKLLYFLDGATQRGASYEALKLFEDFVNKRLGTKTLKVHVVFIPVSRDQLISALVEGRGDIAAANLTITPERQAQVDFSDPVASGVSEIAVTTADSPPLASAEELAGREVWARPSSSYHASLQRLNAALQKAGKKPVQIVDADENLEDSDLLEMVNAGLIPAVIVDSHKAEFWADIFDNIRPYPDAAVSHDGKIAWAFRKNSPKLKAVVNDFVKGHKQGTLHGNILLKRYLRDNKWARNALAKEELEKFNGTVAFFEKYGGQYELDTLMLAALAYQESGLDQSKRSPTGAIGVMQILPSTAADPNVGIKGIEKIEPNIHAGTKYLRFLRDRYFDDDAIDRLNQALFTFAAYNAGPARVAKLRKEAEKMRLNPNVWFDNVEVVAAKRIGQETVQYVSNIYKYYVAYTLVERKRKAAEEAKRKISK